MFSQNYADSAINFPKKESGRAAPPSIKLQTILKNYMPF